MQTSRINSVLPFKGINDRERLAGFLFRSKITPWQYSAETSTHYWIVQMFTVYSLHNMADVSQMFTVVAKPVKMWLETGMRSAPKIKTVWNSLPWRA